MSEQPGLEGRLERLDRIVAALEADDLDLEKALALFEEGVAHVRAAERILAEAELKVEELLQGGRTRPLEAGDE
jgi:exodeoxyribonuclease VII small subunit